MRSFLNVLIALPGALAVATIDRRQSSNTIPGSWIVTLEEGSTFDSVTSNLRTSTPIEPKHEYSVGTFQGFAVDGDDATVEMLSNLEGVKHIEPDTIMYASVPIDAEMLNKRALTTQSPAEYGLARISHRARGQSGYIYDTTAGSGSTIYVVDTGVYTQHSEFQGRATLGANFVTTEGSADGHGHGTHCAGTAAGVTYGVAKRANIIGVKVLASDGRGSNSQVLAGIDWAVNNARTNGRAGRSVISMSIGGEFSQASNNAVAQAVQNGVFVAVAAGNAGVNAADTSPASEPLACTVGATDANDARASFSNFGSALDIFGPGVNIKSSWIGSTTATNTISGTSMATPHIAGLAAYLIALEGQFASPQALCQRIQTLATKNVITNAGSGSTNLLAYNGNGA